MAPPDAGQQTSHDDAKQVAAPSDIHFQDGQEPPFGNPDHWVEAQRDKALLRRTGLHPFNAEVPLSDTLNEAWTPADRHYTRNHGDVPKLSWESHILHISAPAGAADEPHTDVVKVSMDELASLPNVELAATFACDGNRRKEVNMIKRSQGFDWAAGAVSTSVWKGVLLRDVLNKYVRQEALEAGKFVCFEAVTDEHLGNGPYATSIPLATAMETTSDVLLAFGMNGERLPPDHGFPLRCLLPGHVGGRMVKWLSKIQVTKEESQNWHHFHDNRVLPPQVTNPALATPHWKNPDTILYELNINSVIVAPGHKERLSFKSSDDTYAVRGYAYAGGGRKVRYVEVSLDGGRQWDACTVKYPEGYEPRHGTKWWVMARWCIEVPVWRLLRCEKMIVRAWDSSLNSQPNVIKWNLLGMMNNAWYRVKVVVIEPEDSSNNDKVSKDGKDKDGDALPQLEFRHPVSQTEKDGGGWMEPGDSPQKWKEETPARQYTAQDVAAHNKRDDCWVIIDEKVYDLTSFLSQHPGGVASIMVYAGQDASAVFAAIHAADAYALKASYAIGRLVKGKDGGPPHISQRPRMPAQDPDGHPLALSTRSWVKVKLLEKENLTHDTRRIVFELPSRDYRLWLPWGKHLNLALRPNAEDMIVRPYTPVKPVLKEEDNGTFELCIKIYFPHNGTPGGELTTLLEKMKPGDTAEIRGPDGRIHYKEHGTFMIEGHFVHARRVNFVVGGTGLTPAYAIVTAILLAEKNDKMQISMVFANKTVDDILMHKELSALAEQHSNFKIIHVISSKLTDEQKQQPQQYAEGRVNEALLRNHCYEARPDTLALVCGPPGFVSMGAVPGLQAMGFDEDHLFEF